MQLVNKNDPPRPRPMEQRRCRAPGLAVSMAGRRLRADTPTRRRSAPRAGDAGPFPGPFLLLCICASRSHTVSCFCYKQATRGVGGGHPLTAATRHTRAQRPVLPGCGSAPPRARAAGRAPSSPAPPSGKPPPGTRQRGFRIGHARCPSISHAARTISRSQKSCFLKDR